MKQALKKPAWCTWWLGDSNPLYASLIKQLHRDTENYVRTEGRRGISRKAANR